MSREFDLPDVILLNGASSSGKSTFARALQMALPQPYFNYSSDLLVDGGMLPAVDRTAPDTVTSWNVIRPKFFQAFHRSIPAFVSAGNRLIVEHVVEFDLWLRELVELLSGYCVLYVGFTCPIPEIEARELRRGNRYIGEGRSHIEGGIHAWSEYDLVIDTHARSTAENVAHVLALLPSFNKDESVFRRLRYAGHSPSGP
jgi:chloramphenicol 3-O phosphotransferase